MDPYYDYVSQTYINKATIGFTNDHNALNYIPSENRDNQYNENEKMQLMKSNVANVKPTYVEKILNIGYHFFVEENVSCAYYYQLAKLNLSTVDNFRMLNKETITQLHNDKEKFAAEVIRKIGSQRMYDFCVTTDQLDDYTKTLLTFNILQAEISENSNFTVSKVGLPANSFITSLNQWINGETKIAPHEQRIEVFANGTL